METVGVTLRWGAATDVGCARSVNEDSLFAESPLFVVADGMGGHQAGDAASQLVVERFASTSDGHLPTVGQVVDALRDAGEQISAEGRRAQHQRGMGTTAVGLALVDNGDRCSWLIFNIGDSRVYRYADKVLEQLSVDHSYVQELVDAGQISAASARTHPDRNVVTRALGSDEPVEPDLWLRPPIAGERFLLCSDGLNSELDDGEIARLMSVDSVDQAARDLVAGALGAGGHDNVTVVVVEVVDVDDGQEAADTAPRGLMTVEPPPGTPDGASAVQAVASALIDRVPSARELDREVATVLPIADDLPEHPGDGGEGVD